MEKMCSYVFVLSCKLMVKGLVTGQTSCFNCTLSATDTTARTHVLHSQVYPHKN